MTRRASGEGTIFRRRDGRWVGEVRLPDGRRRTYYGKTQDDVRRKVTQAVRDRDRGLAVTPGRVPTVGKWLTDWLESLQVRRSVRARTFEGYRRRDIVPALGRIRLDG